MKKRLTERNIILLVLCIIVIGWGISHWLSEWQQMEYAYFSELRTTVYRGHEMIGGETPAWTQEGYSMRRDTFIVARTQLWAYEEDRAELCDWYDDYPRAFQLFQWYANSSMVNIPLSIDAYSDGSNDADAQKFRKATQIMMTPLSECYADETQPDITFHEYLELIETDSRIDELGLEEVVQPY